MDVPTWTLAALIEMLTDVSGDVNIHQDSANYRVNVEFGAFECVNFVEVIVELTNGEIISKPVENNSLYFVSIPTEAQVSDITFKTVEDIRYSDYFSESLDGAPSFVEGDEVDG